MKKLLCALSLLATGSFAFAGQQTVTPGVTIDLGGGALAGTGNQIQVLSAPVYSGGAGPVYYNATFDLQFLPDGRLAAVVSDARVASGPASIPTASALNFLPGKYKDVATACIWTLAEPGIEAWGGRSYTMTRDDPACAETYYYTSFRANYFSWSTVPVPQNANIDSNATSTHKSVYPGGYAWGWASFGGSVRASATGSSINLTGYNYWSGQASGNYSRAFIKQ